MAMMLGLLSQTTIGDNRVLVIHGQWSDVLMPLNFQASDAFMLRKWTGHRDAARYPVS